MSKLLLSTLTFFLLLSFESVLYSQAQQSEGAEPPSGAKPKEAEVVDSLHYVLEEVMVTATRTDKKIIDIPYAVHRFVNTQFKFDRKVAVNDVLGTVPGLFLQSRYGNHDVRISIRGFGSRSNTGIRGVRILLDGIPESEPDGQTRIEALDFNAIGAIEIVKGNSSSLYTNAPGGVVNFINDIYFPRSFALSFNQFGSYDLRQNGFKAGVRTPNYTFLATYSYHNYRGYRDHSEDYWHIFNTVLETRPGEKTNLQLLGYFVDGLIRLPGSLTKEQFEENPFQANSRDVGRDAKRITTKGRLGLRFNAYLDKARKNSLEWTSYGTIKIFDRTARTYRIITRYGIGTSARYINKTRLLGRANEFSVGGDLLYQAGPVEEYDNIAGQKGDELQTLVNEVIGNAGVYFLNTFTLIPAKMDFLFSGRYDKVVFDQEDRLLGVRSAQNRYEAFTPKAALNYKLTPSVALYTSYGRSFDSPAGNELDNYPTSSNPNVLLNPDLLPQKSRNFELGIKGGIFQRGALFFNNANFEATFFNSEIDDEIVPFEVYGDVYFRNSARTNRTGLEVGGNLEIVKDFRFETAYTFSDFKYDQYTARSTEVDSLGDIVNIDRDYSGNVVPSVPRHNLFLSLAWEPRLTGNLTGFVKGSYRYVSGMFTDDFNSEKSDGYGISGATVGADLRFNRFNLLISGGVDNMFDEVYVGFININSTSREYYEAGAPRNYFGGVNLGYTF